MIILSSAYLGPIEYFSLLKKNEDSLIEHHEHFIKQTYRSRCEIYSPNGLHTLSIPLVKRNHRQSMKDIQISYDYDWRTIHWRTLESSYKRSPFFEYYEDDLYPFFHQEKYKYLIELNQALQEQVLLLLKLKTSYSFTKSYKAEYPNLVDLRNVIIPKSEEHTYQPKKYTQVFETRHGFLPNLSIVDLLFNEGPRACDYF